MPVKDLHILPTDKTPDIYLGHEGVIKIKGRALTIRRTTATEQIADWIDAYAAQPADTTYLFFHFDYLNSFFTGVILSSIRKISQVLKHDKKLVIRWYYEDGDDDILERGNYIAASLNIPIEFIVHDSSIDF